MMASPQTRLRLAILAFAMLIGVQAAWVLVAELAAFAAGGARGAAELARWRGDLWAACAQDGRNEAAAERAVRLAPHEAGAWLVLASFPPPASNPADSLKMSYYTGPNAAELMPPWLFVSVQLAMLADGDIHQLMRRDIRTIVSPRTHLNPTIVAAHRIEAQRAIEAAVAEVDTDLLGALRAGAK